MAAFPNMNTFHDIPLETPQTGTLTMTLLHSSFSHSNRKCSGASLDDLSVRIREANVHRDHQWYSQSTSDMDKENRDPNAHIDNFTLTSLSPLDALPLSIRAFDGPWSESDDDTDMDIDFQQSPTTSSTPSSVQSITLRERRLQVKAPNARELSIYVPPVGNDFYSVSPVLVGSSDFVIWLEHIVAKLHPCSETAEEAQKHLLAAASNPTAEAFQSICTMLQDEDLIAEFVDRLATHLIHFGEDKSDGLRSAWSDSTSSDNSDYDISPADVAMDFLRSVDDAIDEVSLTSLNTWSFPSDGEPTECDITGFSGPDWL